MLAPQTCSSGPMEGDASETVDPTGRPNSKFMVPSQQLSLNLVASAATEDPGRQLPSSAIAVKKQVACMNTTSVHRSVASSSGTAFEYVQPHFSAPAQESAHFSKPAPARATEELGAPSVASTNPLKMDAELSAAAGPPGNPRGSDGPTVNACGSESTTRSLRTTSALAETLGGGSKSRDLRAVSSPGAALGTRGTSTSGGRDLRTASALGEALGGRCTPTCTGNPRGSNGLSRGGAPARRSSSKESRFFSSSSFP